MSKLSCRQSSPVLASVTALTLLCGWVNPAYAAEKASVLGLEGDDSSRASALSKALQAEFAARGLGGGREMSFAELKLTMGCDEPPAAACLASGGKTLGVDRLIYGTLVSSGKAGGFTLNLSVMDVASSTVQQTATVDLGAAAVADGALQATAKGIVNQILGPEPAQPEPAAVAPTVDNTSSTEGPAPEQQPKWLWGRHDTAKWKRAGLAVSATLTVVSLGVGIGTWMVARPGGKIRHDLLAAAQETDIDINMDGDLCAEAARIGEISVTRHCDRGKTMAGVATAAFVATGVFAASTLVFTTLLFVRKNKSAGVAKLQRHDVQVGVTPVFGGGAMLGGAMRF